jgi:5-methylcytosine-specific restriction protein A
VAGWPYTTQRWKRLRAAKLQDVPLCEECQRVGLLVFASVVDHIQPIRHGGEPFPALDGLASLCPPCHSAKTARGIEAGAVRTTRRRVRRGCTASGMPIDPLHPWTREKSLRAEALDTGPYSSSQLVSKSGPADG